MSYFEIEGKDRRQEFLKAFDDNTEFITQVVGGQDASGKVVEEFNPDAGFVLRRKEEAIKLHLSTVKRAASVARLSMGPTLELREFYYTLRGQPKLVEPFLGTENVYGGVLASIKNLEIMCDVDRADFTVGNFPKGVVHYAFLAPYNDREKPIGFTENIARRVLQSSEVKNAMNIVQLEKQAAATRLVSMGFSELTNSIITTTGGFFTRATYELTKRFKEEKSLIFMCDGDVYGNSMIRAVEFGTQNSPHLTPQQAFPSKVYSGIHIAGFFPSVGEKLDLPNDLEQKRPLGNPQVQKMIKFFKKFDLIDDRDIASWERNNTYELEALSTNFKNKQGDPVGLGIYLVEYMRLKGLPCKPQPSSIDSKLRDQLVEAAKDAFEAKVRPRVDTSFVNDMVDAILDPIRIWLSEVKTAVVEEYTDEVVAHAGAQDMQAVRNQLGKQYERNPRREIYDIDNVVDKMFENVEVETDIDLDEVRAEISKVVESIKPKIEEILKKATYSSSIDLNDLQDPGQPKDFYDVVEKELGVDKADAAKVQNALKERLQS